MAPFDVDSVAVELPEWVPLDFETERSIAVLSPQNMTYTAADVPLESIEVLEPLQADSPIEIIPQEIIQPIDEAAHGANPTEAPKEAHPEVVGEDVVGQVESGEDSQAVVEASTEENSES